MVRATLTIELPAGEWLHHVTTTHPNATVQILAAVHDSSSTFVLVRIVGPDASAVVDDVDGRPGVADLTVLEAGESEATVHFETADAVPFPPASIGDPVAVPVGVRDGTATLEVVGSRERLARIVERLEVTGIEYRIEEIREGVYERRPLSERQREMLVAAVERGYYDTPRRCSLTELAEQLGVAKSTCSQTLHRAEGAIIKRFVEELTAEPDTSRATDGRA